MNVEEAKTIPMSEFLEKLGYKPYRNYPDSALYKSPLRIEKTASFRVNKNKNVWYDHGVGKGGKFFQFLVEYLKSQNLDHTAGDALRLANQIWGNQSIPSFVSNVQPTEKDKYKLKLNLLSELEHPALINYLGDRCIPPEFAKPYFKQASVQNTNTGKSFKAIALKNESGGFELKNKLFKGSIGEKDVSFIRGSKVNQTRINIFEGMMDFISVLVLLNVKKLRDDTIILNSLACLPKAYPLITISKYNEVYSWLDNDRAGETHRELLKQFVQSQDGLRHISLNKNYEDYKDVNEWLMSNPKIETHTLGVV